MFIYLAHPIDQSRQAVPMVNVVSWLRTLATEQGHVLFNPGQAYSFSAARAETPDKVKVDQVNRNALWEADAMLAVIWPGVPTLGVPSEIEEALMLNRPTCIVTTATLADRSVQIAAWQNRGATIRHAEPGTGLIKLNLADALGSLPDPTQLISGDAINEGPPPLLVRYTDPMQPTLTQGKYEGDAGIDLAIAEDISLAPTEYALVGTGAHVAIPQGWFGWITGRSSTWVKHHVDVRTGIIDSGYRGELKVGLHNLSQDTPVKFEAGTRLGQMILLPTFPGGLQAVDELPVSQRGLAGYGSSGV